MKAADLSGLRAKGQVHDALLKRRPSARAAQVRGQTFTDGHGHRISLGTDIPGLDLAPYASILAATRHSTEIEELVTWVIDPAQVGAFCGDSEAAACYAPEDPAGSYRGQMVIPQNHDDLAHIIVHEYGHHIDNQLANLGHIFRGACGFDNDGSRNWFFARDVDDNILGRGISCDPDADWDRLLGELYAEDYAWLVGNRQWVLPRERNPSKTAIQELVYDIENPLDTLVLRNRRTVPRRQLRILKRFSIDDWRFVTAWLRGRQAADLDLFIYRRGGRRPLEKSRGRSSQERIDTVLAPGRYELVVYAYRATGRARVRLDLD